MQRYDPIDRPDMLRLFGMMALFFLVVCAVGILRPVKNALALDGLGETQFYRVYLVSAVVVLFVPIYNWLSDRVDHRRLIMGVGLFFAVNLVVFRMLYADGSTAFGLIFYGWYDLFAAALVTQFFLATQLFFDARMAKRAYPIVIAGGSIGATLGSLITGFFAVRIGTPNLLLVAATLLGVFAVALPLVWEDGPEARRGGGRRAAGVPAASGRFGSRLLRDLRELAGSRHVRMIAGLVLVTILAKQLVDYQFNTITKLVFEERDAITAFQGKFNGATQWLPLVALAALPPLLRRWGVAAAVLLLPSAVLLSGTALALAPGLWAAVAAKGAETSLRYSAERAGREILYVPVAQGLKFKAKTAIDIAIEKGIGKVASALLIFLLLQVMPFERIGWVTVGLAALWLVMALAAKGEYVRTLAGSMEGRFASLRGVFASLLDATTLPAVRRALSGSDPLRTAFALDLLEQANVHDARPLAEELKGLVGHEAPELRQRALDLLAGCPGAADEASVRERLTDTDPAVREAAVRACFSLRPDDAAALTAELLASRHADVRMATLSCLARGELPPAAREAARASLVPTPVRPDPAPRVERMEAALAAGLVGPEGAVEILVPLLRDADPDVAAMALYSAGLLGLAEFHPHMIARLRDAPTRPAARASLIQQGERVQPALTAVLLDPSADRNIRRSVPSVLAGIPAATTVAALIRATLAPATDQVLDYRSIKALGKLRARHSDLVFDRDLCLRLTGREAEAALRYRRARAALAEFAPGEPTVRMLDRALAEAWTERRETTFRVLGLIHDAHAMQRCHQAVTAGGRMTHANALEWLESTLGRPVFEQLHAVLEPAASTLRGTPPGRAAVEALVGDEDAWVAACAVRALGAARVPAGHAAGGLPPAPFSHTPDGGHTMDVIEKVFLLQGVDILRDAPSGHLAMLASIAEETEVEDGCVLLRAGEPADALHVVVNGVLALHGVGDTMTVEAGAAVGTWSLIDEAPSPVEARALGSTRLLRITREDFNDLVSDNPELALGLLRGLARRMRVLVG